MTIRKYFFFCMLISCLAGWLFFTTTVRVQAAVPKNVGFISFQNTSGRRGLDDLLQTALLSELSKISGLNVIDRHNLDKILNEQSLSRTGVIAKDSNVEMGKVSGIQYLITGTVLETNPAVSDKGKIPKVEISVFWEILDTTSGTIVFATTTDGSVDKILTKGKDKQKTWVMPPSVYTLAAQDAARKISQQIDEKLNLPPISAHIASIAGNTLYIDAGSNKQIVDGQVFTVYEEGTEISSPTSGEILGRQKRIRCRIMITSVEPKYSTGTLMDGNLLNVKIGDTVVRQ